ncbi:MAG: RdgB/HAM1 family non-canonical purine NTP pyrophosphatase [Christensenellaceae bacterium]|jgi:XTP/dITP diphosphohydrolase|nr:RdgB/HAM1 family non-canonical purine NTP pyrophosphatase [Christensenellaceae bacterium]
MRLIIASNNAHKIAEIKAILGAFYEEILSLKEAGIDIDVVEDGDTFLANALKKAQEVFAVCDADAALSDDSGLMVQALEGAPGVYSARYAGAGHDDAANNAKLLEAMQGVPNAERGCRFVSAVALVRRGLHTLTAQGQVEGRLLRAPQGENGFGYDPLFYYEPLHKSFAELTAAQKNGISHRKRAIEALCAQLERPC